jgi:hypothetical protein
VNSSKLLSPEPLLSENHIAENLERLKKSAILGEKVWPRTLHFSAKSEI